MVSDTQIARTARRLQSAESVVLFAGSGLSAESGVPTFRGEDGLYSDEKVATYTRVRTLTKQPGEVLTWYQKRRDMVREVSPNEGHRALARMSRQFEAFDVATQNVDNLLERAWSRENGRGVIRHLHGEITDTVCHDCGSRPDNPDIDLSELPKCGDCGGLLRPGVVLFGEPLPTEAFESSRDAAARAEACLVVGTSGLVYPAARIPEVAARRGAFVVEVNPNVSGLSDRCDECLRGEAGDILPALEEQL